VTTIAQLVIQATLDATGVKVGVKDAEDALRRFLQVGEDSIRETSEITRAMGLAEVAAYKMGETNERAQQRAERAAIRAGEATIRSMDAAAQSMGRQEIAAYKLAEANVASAERSARAMGLVEIEAYKMDAALTASAGIQIRNAGRIGQGLVSLVAQATGTIPVIDRIGYAMLGLTGAPLIGLLAIVGAVAALAEAYKHSSDAAKDATKIEDEHAEVMKASFVAVSAYRASLGDLATGTAPSATLAIKKLSEEIATFSGHLGSDWRNDAKQFFAEIKAGNATFGDDFYAGLRKVTEGFNNHTISAKAARDAIYQLGLAYPGMQKEAAESIRQFADLNAALTLQARLIAEARMAAATAAESRSKFGGTSADGTAGDGLQAIRKQLAETQRQQKALSAGGVEGLDASNREAEAVEKATEAWKIYATTQWNGVYASTTFAKARANGVQVAIEELALAREQVAASSRLTDATQAATKLDRADPERAAAKVWREHIEGIKDTIASFKVLDGEHAATRVDAMNLVSAYDALGREYDKIGNKSSKAAKDLLELKKAFETTRVISSVSGGLFGDALDPSTARGMAGKQENASTTASSLIAEANELKSLGMANTEQYAKVLDALRIVDSFLALQNVRVGITTKALKDQVEIGKIQIAALPPLPMPSSIAAGMDPSLTLEARRARESMDLGRAAQNSGARGADEMERAANAERDKTVRHIRAIIEASQTWVDITDNEREGLANLQKLMSELGERTSHVSSAWDGLRQGIHGVLDAASGLNKIPRWLNDGVNSSEHLIDSIKATQKAKDGIAAQGEAGGGIFGSIGNVASMLGPIGSAVGSAIGIAGAIGGMFRQHDEALDKNTKRLDELRSAMVDTKGVGGQDLALRDIQQWIAGGRSGPGANQGLDEIVTKSGLTIAQFNKMATDLGITFGRGTGWVTQFGDALQLAITSANKFSGSLDDQRSLSDLRLKVSGASTPVAKMMEELGLLGQFAPKIKDQLGTIDVATTEGRAALRNALKNLVDQIAAGTLTPDQLGSLKGVKDLAGIISNLAGGLDTLASSVGAAASAINGVSWYKVNRAIYDVAPSRPAGQGGSTSVPGSTTQASQSVNVATVNINVPETDPEKIRKVFLTSMQRKAQTLFGNSSRWAEVMT